jgi:hypothetical protein
MSNSYGFDFLKSQHTLGGSDAPRPVLSTAPSVAVPVVSAADVAHKPALEKQADILKFLKAHRSAGYLGPSIIYKGTGIDLEETDEAVARLLQTNAKISIEHVPDPENPSVMVATYAYQSKYNHVRDRASLLAQINRSKYGCDRRDLVDCYDGVEEHIQSLITAGDIIAIANSEDKTIVLFPRGESFLIEMDGIISIPTDTPNSSLSAPPMTDDEVVKAAMDRNRSRQHQSIVWVNTDMDPTKQVRRGEAICVGGQWFRVSSAVKAGVSLSEQPARAQAPFTVTSLQDLSKRNEVDGYVRPFTNKILPLDGHLSLAAKENLQKSKEARQLVHKLAGGRGHSGGATQLLSSLAHATNPASLAASFASAVVGGGRKRPTSNKASQSAASVDQARKAAQAAQEAASDPNLSLYTHARRHGCTKDVRDMYLKTRSLVPTDEMELYKLLVEYKLLEDGEAWRRDKLKRKANVDNDGKPKKRRYYVRKNQKMTNTHLAGTAIGAVLADAAEKQKQGKSVGDGGM